jgi:hypothetical protein
MLHSDGNKIDPQYVGRMTVTRGRPRAFSRSSAVIGRESIPDAGISVLMAAWLVNLESAGCHMPCTHQPFDPRSRQAFF